jgi:hypothetical protein
MRDWILFEQAVVGWTGLHPDALILLASLGTSLLVALVIRRPLATPAPWLLVLLVGAGHEAAVILADGEFNWPELAPSARDLLLFMAVPSLLALVGRFRPQLIAVSPDRRILVPTVWEKKAPVVHAAYRENPEAEPRISKG